MNVFVYELLYTITENIPTAIVKNMTQYNYIRDLLTIAGLLTLPLILISQRSLIETDVNPKTYPGKTNYLKVLVENESCESILVTTQKGSIKKSELYCCFEYTNPRVGADTLEIFTIHNLDTTLIEKRIIYNSPWPEQYAKFGTIKSGSISLTLFNTIKEVTVPLYGFDMSGYHNVVSYNIIVIRGKRIIHSGKNIGGKFSKENELLLKKVNVGDIVEITNIKANIVGETSPRTLNNLKLKITN